METTITTDKNNFICGWQHARRFRSAAKFRGENRGQCFGWFKVQKSDVAIFTFVQGLCRDMQKSCPLRSNQNYDII